MRPFTKYLVTLLKFSIYLPNISWSNVFGKFVLIVYAKKQRFQLFIWCKAHFYSSIYIKITGKSVKNGYFDFSRFCKKNLPKCCELISISIAFKMAPIKQSNLKIKESIIEFYKLHSKKGYGYTYNQWKSKSRKKLTMIL